MFDWTRGPNAIVCVQMRALGCIRPERRTLGKGKKQKAATAAFGEAEEAANAGVAAEGAGDAAEEAADAGHAAEEAADAGNAADEAADAGDAAEEAADAAEKALCCPLMETRQPASIAAKKRKMQHLGLLYVGFMVAMSVSVT